jgi:predicted secreted protein
MGFLTFQTSTKQVPMEIPKKITLRVGDMNTVRLPGLGTAGYAWTHEVIENSGLIEVSTGSGGSPQPGEAAQKIVGASVDELIYIRALRAGRSRIRIIQRRPWETDKPPYQEHIIEVDIKN